MEFKGQRRKQKLISRDRLSRRIFFRLVCPNSAPELSKKVLNAIHWINHYSLVIVICFPSTGKKFIHCAVFNRPRRSNRRLTLFKDFGRRVFRMKRHYI